MRVAVLVYLFLARVSFPRKAYGHHRYISEIKKNLAH